MTKRERARVVELLRCAADRCQVERYAGIYGTWTDLGYRLHRPKDWRVKDLAVEARRDAGAGNWDSYEDNCLEAAARVEEGSWP